MMQNGNSWAVEAHRHLHDPTGLEKIKNMEVACCLQTVELVYAVFCTEIQKKEKSGTSIAHILQPRLETSWLNFASVCVLSQI